MTNDSRTVSDSMEETKVRHERYLRAINSPIRREILRSIHQGNKTLYKLSNALGLEAKTLEWHLNMLIYGYCIEKKNTDEGILFEITQEGLVVDFMDKNNF
jgi:DNA-binding transcriptional ArsR family regulator